LIDPKTEDRLSISISEKLQLASAIERLPEGYRKVFILHDILGYQHAEITRLLGIAAGTSKSQLHKARLKLRSILQEKVKVVCQSPFNN
ncbi:MAG: RNA polymerase sigma factor, partial [Acidobacteriota bacterium]